MLEGLGKLLIWVGGGIVVFGLLLLLLSRIPGIGHLPGDILIRRGNVTFYFPLVTMIVLSAVLTLVLNIIARLHR